MLAEPEIYVIRLGYGLSPNLLPPTAIADYLDSVKRAGPDGGGISRADLQKIEIDHAALSKLAREGDEDAGKRAKEIRRDVNDLTTGMIQSRLARAVGDPAGFGERLVQFWADHFTVGFGNFTRSVLATTHAEETIRPYIGEKFSDMMFAAETHPAMLAYLQQNNSVGPNSAFAARRRRLGLNENLAREMIELHSLGVGADYTQDDVRQLAELLTGLKYIPDSQENFDPKIAEPDAEIVMGQSYGGKAEATIDDIRAVIHDLAGHEATASHIARKLAVHFVSDNPPQELVDRLTEAFRDTNGDLSEVNAALVNSPELVAHFREKVRQPFDFIVAGLRALGMTDRTVMALRKHHIRQLLIGPLREMGQPWSSPRGPDGWPEEAENWVTPPGLAARMNWAFRAPNRARRVLPDPREFMTSALGNTASEALQWAVPKAESKREGVAVVLASSDFNRR